MTLKVRIVSPLTHLCRILQEAEFDAIERMKEDQKRKEQQEDSDDDSFRAPPFNTVCRHP